MTKFKFLLWVFAQLLKRQVKNDPACAQFVRGKHIQFQLRTASGAGRYYTVHQGKISSAAGLAANPAFTLSFKDAGTGYNILSAKDSQAAFLRGLGSADLAISGDFQEVLWFQGLTALMQPPKVVAPYDRTAFHVPVRAIVEQDK